MRDELLSRDWDIVTSLLPEDWEPSARQLGALRRCRNVDSAATLLRLLLLHAAGGLSLYQTTVRAQALGWATLSDVALLKRLRASISWLEYLCSHLWAGLDWPTGLPSPGHRWRIVDATTVQEPAATSTSWRLHYVIGLPTLRCEFVEVTSVRGGETLCRIPVRAGDVLLADRGYSHRAGVAWVLSQGGQVVVRHQGAHFPLSDRRHRPWELLAHLRRLGGHAPGSWAVEFAAAGQSWPVWLHAVRKSAAATQRTQEELRRERGESLQPETLELAEYVVVLCSLPPAQMTARQALGLYRGRWQIELVFKTLKGLLGLGELTKHDPDSARGGLQAKLLTALLLERLEREARFFSPWGFPLSGTVRLAGISRDAGQLARGDCASAGAGGRIEAGGGTGAAASPTEPQAAAADACIITDNVAERILS